MVFPCSMEASAVYQPVETCYTAPVPVDMITVYPRAAFQARAPSLQKYYSSIPSKARFQATARDISRLLLAAGDVRVAGRLTHELVVERNVLPFLPLALRGGRAPNKKKKPATKKRPRPKPSHPIGTPPSKKIPPQSLESATTRAAIKGFVQNNPALRALFAPN